MEEVNQKENSLENPEDLTAQEETVQETENTVDKESNEEEREDVIGQNTKQDELADMKDKYLRLYSEFDNFRRRTAREKLELIQSANEKLLIDLLPVIDDFDRAEKSFQNLSKQDKEGFELIQNKFKKTLDIYGVKAMELEKGSSFDPDFQEAITQVATEDESLKGKVVEVIEKGYTLHDKVIRFARVVIGN